MSTSMQMGPSVHCCRERGGQGEPHAALMCVQGHIPLYAAAGLRDEAEIREAWERPPPLLQSPCVARAKGRGPNRRHVKKCINLFQDAQVAPSNSDGCVFCT